MDVTGPAKSILSANCRLASIAVDVIVTTQRIFHHKCVTEANVSPYNKTPHKSK